MKRVQESIRLFLNRPYIPYLILIAGILATCLFTFFISREIYERDKLSFETDVRQSITVIEYTLDTHIALLRAGVGLFAGSQQVTKEEFHAFVERIRIRDRYPGLQGIGYSLRVLPQDKEQIENELRNTVDQDFSITPDSVRDEYHTIMYLEPLDIRNQAAIGFDMFTDPTRRDAMERARDTSTSEMSGKVTMVQEIDPNKQAGFLIYLPIYRNGIVPSTIDERREQLQGFVYSPFRADDLFSGMFRRNTSNNFQYQVYDGEEVVADQLLYSSGNSIDASEYPNFQSVQRVSITGHPWTIVFTGRPMYGVITSESIVPYIFSGGIVISFILFFLSRWQYKAQHQKSEILEGITDGFFSVDRKWRFTYVNHEGARAIGRAQEELIGSVLWNEITRIEKTPFGTLFKQAMKDGKARSHEGFYEPTGEWYSLRLYPSSFGLSVFFQNISRRKQLEKQKDEFIAIASHELKTPVTSIKAYTQILLNRFKKSNEENSVRLMTRMDGQLNKLTELINDLLDATKIESGKLRLQEEQFNFNDLIDEIVEEMQHTTEKHQLVKILTKPVKVFGDRERIGQVITNFLSNAIKYSPDQEKILIKTTKNKDSITLCVQDFGVGISKKDQKKVFDRFYRAVYEKGETYPGLGLGLYISREIIRRQGGKIWAESPIGKKGQEDPRGSQFCFTIPIRKAERG